MSEIKLSETVPSNIQAGVVINDNGVLKIQSLKFSGDDPVDAGEPVELSTFYTFDTGREVPVYTPSGNMEIYKCVDADGMTWWVVSGCGSTEANGRYYEGEEIQGEYGGSYKIYYQKDGSCSLEFDSYYGRWSLKYGSTVFYHDESYNYYNGDPSQCVNWTTDSGIAPAPTIAKESTTGNGWRGKKYATETGEVADTVTTLTYTAQIPEIGKLYTYDATLQITSKSGLLLYAPCAEYGQEVDFWCMGAHPYMQYKNISSGNYTTIEGVPCLLSTGSQQIGVNVDFGKIKNFSASCLFYSTTKSQTGYRAPVSVGTAFGSNDYEAMLIMACHIDNKIYIGDTGTTTTNIDYDINTWNHIAMTFGDGIATFYFNGVAYHSYQAPYSSKIFNYLTFCNLLTSWNTNETYKGAVAEVKLWGKALTADEIKSEADRCLAMVTA